MFEHLLKISIKLTYFNIKLFVFGFSTYVLFTCVKQKESEGGKEGRKTERGDEGKKAGMGRDKGRVVRWGGGGR